MKRILLLIVSLLPLWAVAQHFQGDWGGQLMFGNQGLKIIIHIQQAEDGYRATMDSPDQGAFGMKVSQVTVEDKNISIQMHDLGASYEATQLSEGVLSGTFRQRGMSFPLILTPHKEQIDRPQEPRAPYPYTEREVEFESREQGILLRATLTLPADGQPVAAVVLVTGSGTQNRDEEVFQHKPFKLIADFLTRRGVAVLRYDDRDWGLPEEQLKTRREASTEELAQDALGAVDYLKEALSNSKLPIGILGHSEGGTIAFLAAAAERRVDFIVSLAGSMLRGDQVLLYQNRLGLEQMQMPLSMIHSSLDFVAYYLDFMANHTQEELLEKRSEYITLLKQHPKAQKLPVELRSSIVASYDRYATSRWLHHFIRFDPARAIQKAERCPILALNGTLDHQIESGEHLGRLKMLLPKSKRLTIKEYDGLNHLFQPAKTGLVKEYATITTTLSEEVLHDIAQWIDEVVLKK